MSQTPTLPRAITKALEPAGNALAADVERLTRQLQKALQTIHGGEWRLLIDHEHQIVMVAARLAGVSK